MVGVPALITETFSCSYPKHHRARTHKPEVNKHTIGRAGAACGFEAACLAAERVVEGGRLPDDATVDVPSRRIAAGSGERGGADLSVYDGFLKGAVCDGR